MKIVTIKDPVHKTITLDKNIYVDIINTKEFQRLRRIKQLGNAHFAFPAATHTRFSHSLGTYEIVRKILKGSKLIKKQLTEKEITSTKIAALLHDIGHGPFSHSFEDLNNKHHEEYSVEIIKNKNGEIYKNLKKYGYEPFEIAAIIDKTHPNKLMIKIISSQVDADRMDYLLRDSFFTGTGYGEFDLDWLIQNMTIHDTKTIFKRKALTSLEDYFIGRDHMYRSIYLHKKSIAADFVISSILQRAKDLNKMGYIFKTDLSLLKELIDSKPVSLSNYLELDDESFNCIIKKLRFEDDEVIAELAHRFWFRKLPKVVLIDKKNDRDIENELFNSQKDRHKSKYFYKKETFANVAYKREKKLSTENTYLETSDGKYIPLEKYSPIIQTLSNHITEAKYIFYINDKIELN